MTVESRIRLALCNLVFEVIAKRDSDRAIDDAMAAILPHVYPTAIPPQLPITQDIALGQIID